jgi:glycolate oxidase iron-sulfur subunit
MVADLHPSATITDPKLLACVHCGLCLEACPTYVVTGDENDGPRGRIYLMRAVDEGRLRLSSRAFERHIDRCLGCRACESVCPAGVEYGELLEFNREKLYPQHQLSFSYKALRFALNHVWPYPARLKLFFASSRFLRATRIPTLLRRSGIARLFSPRFEFAMALLESSSPSLNGKRTTPTIGDAAVPAALFTGCVGEGLFGHVNRATERVLQRSGYALDRPNDQVCCGALHAHAGDLDGARRLADKNIKAFANVDGPIVTNAGGCGAMLMSYGHLLQTQEAISFASRIRDVSQLLNGGSDTRPSQQSTVTYDASCHLMYGQRAADSSLTMLREAVGSNFVSLPGAERCCGGAGVYNLLEPELSRRVLEQKLSCIRASGAKTLATGNPGCQMQIGAGAKLAGMDLRVCHPIELLDEQLS